MANHDRPLLTQCCREVTHLQGDAAEIGVYQGHGDDYGAPSCEGAKKAVQEFCNRRGVVPEIVKTRAIIRRQPE